MDHIQMQPKKLPNKIKEIAKGKVQKGEKNQQLLFLPLHIRDVAPCKKLHFPFFSYVS